MALKNLFGKEDASSACGSGCGCGDKKGTACGCGDKKSTACGCGDKN